MRNTGIETLVAIFSGPDVVVSASCGRGSGWTVRCSGSKSERRYLSGQSRSGEIVPSPALLLSPGKGYVERTTRKSNPKNKPTSRSNTPRISTRPPTPNPNKPQEKDLIRAHSKTVIRSDLSLPPRRGPCPGYTPRGLGTSSGEV